MIRNRINYENKKVYIGIDVHKKTYTFFALCEGVIVKKATVPAFPKLFCIQLIKWFKGAHLYSVYESGFSGFELHRKLEFHGITNIVINPASLEVASKDKVKTDKRDAKKLVEQLASGRLKGIFIPPRALEERRQLTRVREQILRNRVRVGNQIKGKLHYFNLIVPTDTSVMSRKFIDKIHNMKMSSVIRSALNFLIQEWIFLDQQLKDLKEKFKEQAFEDQEAERIYLSVPGIGPIGARTLSNELGDLSKRFPNQKSLYQFVGLTPTEYSSGEKTKRGSISRQGSSRIRKILIEASWVAICLDKDLKEIFRRISHGRGSNKAIIAVSRNLIGRIRSCFKNKVLYQTNYVLNKKKEVS